MKCRECLLQLVRSLAKPEMVPPGQDAPQRSNFISWSELIANTVASGGSAERVRGHLKATAKSAWELAGWLTHANGATRHEAVFVLDATHSVLAAFGHAVIRHESGSPERCPLRNTARACKNNVPSWPKEPLVQDIQLMTALPRIP